MGSRNPADMIAAAFQGNGRAIDGSLAFVLASTGLLAGLLLGRIPPVLTGFALCAMILPILSKIEAQARYALALFPLYLLVPALSNRWRLAVFAAFVVGQFVIVYYWLLENSLLT